MEDYLREYISSNESLSSTIGIELTSAAKKPWHNITWADAEEQSCKKLSIHGTESGSYPSKGSLQNGYITWTDEPTMWQQILLSNVLGHWG